jgi:hypothetical protein
MLTKYYKESLRGKTPLEIPTVGWRILKCNLKE